MRVLLVYCHPDPESFCAAVRDAVLEGLAEAGADMRVLDLYAMGFDPVMSCAERRLYNEKGANEEPVREHLAHLQWAEGIVFVYPTWWYALPAMLKGWLDRVWVPHATFRLPERHKPIGRVLTQIRLVAAVSTLGSPRWWWWWMGRPGRRMLLDGIGLLCSPRARRVWLGLHDMDSASESARKAFLRKVRQRIAREARG